MSNLTANALRSIPSDSDRSGRSFGEEELAQLREVLESGILTATKGTKVKAFEKRCSELFTVEACICCSSGSAAIHSALAAINLRPGDEVITSPVTDMGAIAPILFQAAVPVFADICPESFCLTAASVERRISRRTRAIIVTALFGYPVEIGQILSLAAEHDLFVIEDAAQAYLAHNREGMVGTRGHFGCFSMQQGKHISSGEGGFVLTKDPELAHAVRLFVNKGWDYESQNPDHETLGLNYRLSELQGAVALAQLAKLEENVRLRITAASTLTQALAEIPGLSTPLIPASSQHSFWRYALRVDPRIIRGGADALGAKLQERGLRCSPGYIRKPAFSCEVFRKEVMFGGSGFPFLSEYRLGESQVRYDVDEFPGTIQALSEILVLPWNEKLRETHVREIASAITSAVQELS